MCSNVRTMLKLVCIEKKIAGTLEKDANQTRFALKSQRYIIHYRCRGRAFLFD